MSVLPRGCVRPATVLSSDLEYIGASERTIRCVWHRAGAETIVQATENSGALYRAAGEDFWLLESAEEIFTFALEECGSPADLRRWNNDIMSFFEFDPWLKDSASQIPEDVTA